MTHRFWTRDETLVAFNIYCRMPFGRLHARNPEIIRVANAIGRTPSALAMKCCNLAAFDAAQQARGIRGLSRAARLDADVWRHFEQDPESLAFEAEETYSRILHQDLRKSDTVEWEDVLGLDRAVVTKVRVNQQFFRSLVLAGYQGKCAVCALPFPSLMVASHIIPWSIDRTLRMNPRNGICLCALHDKAFDRGLILIAADYKIALHPDVMAVADVESVAMNFVRYAGAQLILPDRWQPDPSLLGRHAELSLSTQNPQV